MKITTLVENTPGAPGCLYEHGLSIYIETERHKILMDTGASDAFLHNARALGIDLKQVDMLVLSHGHYDHAGGLMTFAEVNSRAHIYMRPGAAAGYYHLHAAGAKYIGVDKRIADLSHVVLVGEQEVLDEEISLFSGVIGRRLWPKGNEKLKVLMDGVYEQDSFAHEQYLVLQEQGKSVLVSGCAHNGILNILDKYREIYGGLPDAVISGFHMKKASPLSEEEKTVVRETAMELKQMQGTKFYSGHCTGEEAFGIMKEIMGEQLTALHSGEAVQIENAADDIDAIIALLDGYVGAEGSRLKLQVTEGGGGLIDKQYHHGRCDVGSPWARGAAFDLIDGCN